MPNPDDMMSMRVPHPNMEAFLTTKRTLVEVEEQRPQTFEEQVAAHPETAEQRAVIILASCLAVMAQCEAAGEDPPEQMFFNTPPGGKIGRNGFMSLFPGMANSPVGRFRGEGISCDLVETIAFVGKNFPGVMDQVLIAMYTEIDEPNTEA